MEIVLAGYNVDSSVIEEAKRRGVPEQWLTPEILSAAYARISRNPAPVTALRAQARDQVARARASNQRIIFGMGHHSVAEHAVFNFDIIGVSRLAIEEIEHHRLCSFTEKSQRYITLDGDAVIPEEIADSPHHTAFAALVQRQKDVYKELYDALRDRLAQQHPDMMDKRSTRSTLEGWAKEDARYATLLATGGQLGFTANARNLELAIKRMTASPLAEVRAIGRRLYEEGSRVAPSLLLFTEPTPYEVDTPAALAAWARSADVAPASSRQEPVTLCAATPEGDATVAAALLARCTGRPFPACLHAVRGWDVDTMAAFFRTALQHSEFYDTPPREFEHVHLTFDVVLSAAAYGQLKRHRMMTLTPAPYDPELGITVPPAVREVGKEDTVREFADACAQVYADLAPTHPHAAAYALTNAHRRRVIATTNLRDLYHFCRLREDAHAQWDIRAIAAAMRTQVERVMPLGALLLCGKDAFVERYTAVFGSPPALDPNRLP